MKTAKENKMNMKTSSTVKANPLFLIILALGFIALSPKARAVVPSPDGGYPGFNTAEGQNALFSLTTGSLNTAIGWFSLFSNTDGSFNTAVGAGTLLFNVGDQNIGEGIENTAIGTAALLNNTTGNENTATGVLALLNNTIGIRNTANGFQSLSGNTEGSDNTAIGFDALHENNTGNDNTATGFDALFENTTGSRNTANGLQALLSNTTGIRNTATGALALELSTTGGNNTADGAEALFHNTEGNNNTAVGVEALNSNTDSNNTAAGVDALRNKISGLANTAVGFQAGINLIARNDNIYIGSFGPGSPGNESNTIRIGKGVEQKTFVAGINGVQLNAATNVLIDINGQLGTVISSRRFKKEIQPMGAASETILGLRPVTFHYNTDNTSTPQFGLIAEEVAEVNPTLVIRDKEGKPYTVRYDAVNAMLLNEFLKEHRTLQELKQQITTLTARLKEQDSKIQRVSDQLEVRKPALRMAMSRP